MSLRPGYNSGDLASYLFGSILTVTRADVLALAVLTGLLAVGAALWLRPVMQIAFDRDYSRSQGMPTRLVSYLMSALTAVAIVLSIRIMGIVLLISLLTMPGGDRQYAFQILPRNYLGRNGRRGLRQRGRARVELRNGSSVGAAIIFILTLTLILVKLLPLHSKKRSRGR